MWCPSQQCIHHRICNEYKGSLNIGDGWDMSFYCGASEIQIFRNNVVQYITYPMRNALEYISTQDISLESQLRITKIKKEIEDGQYR